MPKCQSAVTLETAPEFGCPRDVVCLKLTAGGFCSSDPMQAGICFKKTLQFFRRFKRIFRHTHLSKACCDEQMDIQTNIFHTTECMLST